MAPARWFYEGMPLSEYCKKNGLNVTSIRGRVNSKRKQEEYQHLSDEELVGLVISNYGKRNSYFIDGKPLSEYCRENSISYNTIISRIGYLQSSFPEMPLDDVIKRATTEFSPRNIQYYYEGELLVDYCKKVEGLTYDAISSYIRRRQFEDPTVPYTDAINEYLGREHFGRSKYYYLGMSLVEYCKENSINYTTVYAYITNHLEDEKYAGLSGDDLTATIIDDYQPFEPKYMYNGVTLHQYCKENGICYSYITRYVKARMKQDENLAVDKLIEEALDRMKRHGVIYFYMGQPLYIYAKEHDMNIGSLRKSILTERRKNPDESLSVIVDRCVKRYKKLEVKYFYRGQSLKSFCRSTGLNVSTVLWKYRKEYEARTDLTVSEKIAEIVDYYLENPPVQTKYFYGEGSLASFCNEKGYPYLLLISRIKNLKRKNPEGDMDSIVEEAVRKHEEKLHIERIRQALNEVGKETVDEATVKSICHFLKIDFFNVMEYVEMGYTFCQSVNMIWYFGDLTNSRGLSMLSDEKYLDLMSLVEKMTFGQINVNEVDLYSLIGIYKSKLYDTRNLVLLKEDRYIKKVLYSVCESFGVTVDKNNYDDLLSEIKLGFIAMIDRTCMNIPEKVIRYMTLVVPGNFKVYLKKNGTYRNSSLDDLEERGKQIKSNEKDEESSQFGEKMENILTNLDSADKKFVILRYQENYSIDELAAHYNVSAQEVLQKETEILNTIKNFMIRKM